jgi:hypothetical protein
MIVRETGLPAHGAVMNRLGIAALLPIAQTLLVENLLASGALNVHLICGPGVSGAGFFLYEPNFQLDPTTLPIVPVSVLCSATVDILHALPGAEPLPVGTVVTITEVDAPTGGSPATVTPVTLTAGDQTVTVTNVATPVAAGSLSIHKTCATGVTGSAVFDTKVTPFGQATVDLPNLSIECDSTVLVVIPPADDLVGASVLITETTAPTGGVQVPIPALTLTAAAQTVTVVNPARAAAAGNLSIHKTCASGVTGQAVFDAKVLAPLQSIVDVPNVTVQCGGTTVITIPTVAKLVGATVAITETTAATGGVKATIPSATLTATAQTITVNNAKAPTPPVLAQTGSGSESAGLLLALLGLSLLVVGATMRLTARIR